MSYYPGQQQYPQGHQGQQQYPQGHPSQQQYPQGHPGQQQYSQAPAGQQQYPQSHPGQGAVPRPSPAALPSSSADTGTFPGGSYTITHRGPDAALNIELQDPNVVVKSVPGAMVYMAGTVHLAGKTKFSFGKMLTGGEMHESNYTGHGKFALAPTLSGDIFTLQVNPRTHWRIGKDSYLASVGEVTKESKMQGLSKALFSGEDLFVYNISGNGLLWLTSYGGIGQITLQPGEQLVVDNGHLVAWNMEYKIESAGGGFMAARKTGEGLVCRFQGPGTVYYQTRNLKAFDEYMQSKVQSTGS